MHLLLTLITLRPKYNVTSLQKKASMKKMSMKKSGMKRPLNAYFKLMLDAKKKGLTSFKYKGNTYKGKKHEKLGLIYRKA